MEPSTKAITEALSSIEAAERPANHPRTLARTAIKRWRSDAQKLKLTVSNQVDSGAPSLRVDDVLRRSSGHAERIGRK